MGEKFGVTAVPPTDFSTVGGISALDALALELETLLGHACANRDHYGGKEKDEKEFPAIRRGSL